MALTSFLQSLGDISFSEKKHILQNAPYHLEIREHDDLYNIMFTDDSPSVSEFPFIKNCVGTILTKDNDSIVGYGFDKTINIVLDIDQPATWASTLEPLAEEDLSICKTTLYEEGVKITVFFHADRWYVSTNRIIDASKAYWTSSVSFRDQFLEACRTIAPEIEQQISHGKDGPLTVGVSYVFILCSPHNKAVSSISDARLLHAASTSVPALEQLDIDIGVCRPKPVELSSIDQLTAMMKTFEYWMPGVLVFGKQRYKILTKMFDTIKELGGNTPDMRRHYLDIRKDKNLRDQFLWYYPSYTQLAKQIDKDVWHCARALHNMYVQYFILRQQRPVLDKTIFVTLMQIHADYKATSHKRTLQTVYDHVDRLPSPLQHVLLSRVLS